ncbi:MAG TPA: outer membrane lipoprotein carrier protein LolA [Rhizomicrobium sp.]|jgi:outer membrane lipoprotein-sorting protein|nr:outer membrane lipoprotein carrier protein LolA [Rhizomicrobium sp.]
MRRFALAVLIALSSPLLMAGGAPPPPRRLEFNDADAKALDAISAYLNSITTLKGGFVQVEPNGGADEGTFYISKPGKMRFEYNPPSPVLLVSDGHTVAVANRRLNTVDRYPLVDTPLGLILNNTLDLRHNPQLLSVTHQEGSIILGLRTSNNRSKANLALVFSEPDYELRQWSVIDAQGLTTTVALRALVSGTPLLPTLFVLPEKNAFANRREN